MKRIFFNHGLLVINLVFLMIVTACGSSSSKNDQGSSDVSAKIARDWMTLIYDLVRQEGFSPPVASRTYAYSSIALYESVVHSSKDMISLEGQLNGLSNLPKPNSLQSYDWSLVVSVTVAEVARHLFAGRDQALHRINALENESVSPHLVSNRNNPSFAYARSLAGALIRWADADGFLARNNNQFTSPVCDSCWVPTGPVLNPLEPGWGGLRTFVVSVNECSPKPPVEYSESPSSNFFSEALAVYNTSKTLTEDERQIARFWADNPGQTGTPPGHWINIASIMVDVDNVSIEKAVKLYAKVGIAVGDSFISCWHTKYKYFLLRPHTYIRKIIDSEWTSLIGTPPFPEYTSGHSTVSGASAEVISKEFGNRSFTDTTNQSLGFTPRRFSSFRDAASEAANSRLFGGIHYPMGNEEGLSQGKCIGQNINKRLKM
ncbi:MAG TPA: vanadium-dependent haloperoxidase [Oligoflexia bacterium]|nr:vanadium-dependent haloperoxidase [Oligoflexia bacterium]HMP49595.1 vanadium-dependent haloperoxidase [Oligoflexia bacterium]